MIIAFICKCRADNMYNYHGLILIAESHKNLMEVEKMANLEIAQQLSLQQLSDTTSSKYNKLRGEFESRYNQASNLLQLVASLTSVANDIKRIQGNLKLLTNLSSSNNQYVKNIGRSAYRKCEKYLVNVARLSGEMAVRNFMNRQSVVDSMEILEKIRNYIKMCDVLLTKSLYNCQLFTESGAKSSNNIRKKSEKEIVNGVINNFKKL